MTATLARAAVRKFTLRMSAIRAAAGESGRTANGRHRRDLYPASYMNIPTAFPICYGEVEPVAESVSLYHVDVRNDLLETERSEEHTSELQSLMRNSYALFCL